MTDDTDRGIIEQTRNGDRNAYAGIIDKYKGRIYSLAFRLSGSYADADELVQTIFVKTFETLNQFNNSKPFFPWLYTISLNTIRNHCKRKKLRAFFSTDLFKIPPTADHLPANPEDRLLAQETIIQLAAGLNKLPYRQREAIVLRYYEECAYREIAAFQKVSLSAAKMRVRRGMAKLQKLMGKTI